MSRRKSPTGKAWIDHDAPFYEAAAHDFPIVPGSQQMATPDERMTDTPQVERNR